MKTLRLISQERLSSLKKKIRFYVDSAFPDKWRKAVKEGIEYWNMAFEEAGFKNAIEALDYPDDPGFRTRMTSASTACAIV